MRTITITSADIQPVRPASTGSLATQRANDINEQLTRIIEKNHLRAGSIVTTTSAGLREGYGKDRPVWYALERLGIYFIERKGKLPTHAVLCISDTGKLAIHMCYRTGHPHQVEATE